MFWPSRTLTEMLPTRLSLLAPSPPQMRLRSVLIGIISTSSWSWPMLFWPLAVSTPTTVMGTPRTRMVWSTGSSSPKSSRAAVAPIQATLADPAMSVSSNKRPALRPQSRASR